MLRARSRHGDSLVRQKREEQRCETARHLIRLRVAAAMSWFLYYDFFGMYGGHADFRLNAPLVGLYAVAALALYLVSMHSASTLQRSWLSVPLLDLPVMFIVQYRGTPVALTPIGNAAFSVGMLAIIIVVAQLTMRVRNVLLTAAAAIVLEVVLLMRAGVSLYGWLGAFIVLSVIGLAAAAVVDQFSVLLREVVMERTRMAQEIHDTLAQDLVGISVHLENVAAAIDDDAPAARAHLERVRSLARSSLEHTRRSMAALRREPAAATDLCDALNGIADRLAVATPAPIHIEVVGAPRRLSADVHSSLLRIAQEALTNAARHACARSIELELRFERRRVLLYVRDDGHGFPAAAVPEPAVHFGLVGMRERAERMGGSFEVCSGEGRGTEIKVAV